MTVGVTMWRLRKISVVLLGGAVALVVFSLFSYSFQSHKNLFISLSVSKFGLCATVCLCLSLGVFPHHYIWTSIRIQWHVATRAKWHLPLLYFQTKPAKHLTSYNAKNDLHTSLSFSDCPCIQIISF